VRPLVMGSTCGGRLCRPDPHRSSASFPIGASIDQRTTSHCEPPAGLHNFFTGLSDVLASLRCLKDGLCPSSLPTFCGAHSPAHFSFSGRCATRVGGETPRSFPSSPLPPIPAHPSPLPSALTRRSSAGDSRARVLAYLTATDGGVGGQCQRRCVAPTPTLTTYRVVQACACNCNKTRNVTVCGEGVGCGGGVDSVGLAPNHC